MHFYEYMIHISMLLHTCTIMRTYLSMNRLTTALAQALAGTTSASRFPARAEETRESEEGRDGRWVSPTGDRHGC